MITNRLGSSCNSDSGLSRPSDLPLTAALPGLVSTSGGQDAGDDDSSASTFSPCPFCGRNDVYPEQVNTESWAVCCFEERCGAMGPLAPSRVVAIERWERREGASRER